MAGLYVSPHVAWMRELDERFVHAASTTVAGELEARAHAVLHAQAAGHPAVDVLIANFLPELRERVAEGEPPAPLDLEQARRATLREHGFEGAAPPPQLRHDPHFAAALALTLHGRVGALRALLRRDAGLARARSAYGHRATLLHHLAANAVEIRHQVVHDRAPKVAVVLLEAGADVAATARAYGGEHTTLALLLTSEHPRTAGIAADLAHVLRATGSLA